MAPPLWLLPRSRVLGPSRASPRATPRMRAATVICHTTGEWDHSANGYVHEYRLQFDGCKNPFKGRYFRQSELRPLDERKVRVDAMGYVRHARAPDAPSPPSDGDDDALRAPDAPSPPSDGDDDASSEGPRKRGKKEASIDDDDGGDGGGGGGDDGDDDAMEEHQGAAVDDAVEGYQGGDVHEAADLVAREIKDLRSDLRFPVGALLFHVEDVSQQVQIPADCSFPYQLPSRSSPSSQAVEAEHFSCDLNTAACSHDHCMLFLLLKYSGNKS